jgi:hypothetical protein
MTEQPAKQDDDIISLSSFERYSIFNEIYNGRFTLNPEDDLFEMSFKELESVNTSYPQYLLKLKDVEEKMEQEQEKMKQAEERFKQKHRKAAERQFFSIAGAYLFESIILKQICDELGPLLFEFVNQNLTPAQEGNVIRVIRRVLGNDLKTCNDLLAVLGFDRTARSFKCETGWLKTKTMSPYKESFDQYTQLAMSFELDDPELKVIVANILDPIKFIFRNGTFEKPLNVHHYSAIIGPSFMGKTQFSFILARTHPVFYFNFFLNRESPQDIYCCFSSYSKEILKVITMDTETLSKTVSLSELLVAGKIFLQENLKLFTIGFIWSLIEHSMKFDFSKKDGRWFNHFLENREVSYTALSFNEFYDKMGKIVS